MANARNVSLIIIYGGNLILINSSDILNYWCRNIFPQNVSCIVQAREHCRGGKIRNIFDQNHEAIVRIISVTTKESFINTVYCFRNNVSSFVGTLVYEPIFTHSQRAN